MLVLDLGGKALIDHLAFSPNGRALVGNADFHIVIWPAFAEDQSGEWMTGGQFCLFPRFANSGRWVFGSLDQLFRFDVKTRTRTEFEPWADSGVTFDLSPTKPLMLVSRYEIGKRNRTQVALWRVNDLSPAGRVWLREFDEFPFRAEAQFLAGGARFVRLEPGPGSGVSYRCTTYDTRTGAAVGEPVPLPHWGTVSPDGRWLAKLDGATVHLFPIDPTAGSPARIKNDTRKHFTGFAFHPSGRFVAATANDATVKLYDTATWRPARTFAWDIGKMRCVAFGTDGTLAAAGSDKGKVVVWDVDE